MSSSTKLQIVQLSLSTACRQVAIVVKVVLLYIHAHVHGICGMSCAESCHCLLSHVYDGASMTAAPSVFDHAKLYSPCVCNDGIASVKISCVKQSNSMQEGQKAIFHLEAFVARFMSDYKTWTIQAFG